MPPPPSPSRRRIAKVFILLLAMTLLVWECAKACAVISLAIARATPDEGLKLALTVRHRADRMLP